ncbi:MAG: hypothetical protein DI613_23645, partial [Kocuria rhizophila]
MGTDFVILHDSREFRCDQTFNLAFDILWMGQGDALAKNGTVDLRPQRCKQSMGIVSDTGHGGKR